MNEEEDNDNLDKFVVISFGQFGHDEFMEIFYHLLDVTPGHILEYDEDTELKIDKLNYIIKFFEDKEEYEKCARIKEVQQMLRDSI
jgi:hypothetical protein